MRKELFRRRANRLLLWLDGYGWIPTATELDDKPVFMTAPPQRTGDDAIVLVEGQRRAVRLIRGWLVDHGPAPSLIGRTMTIPKPPRYGNRSK